MRVCILGFGSVWRKRRAKGSDDPMRFARGAFYNTTGVVVEGRPRTRPRIIGHVRFNGVGGFNPNNLGRMIGRVFECEEPCVWRGQNKILFKTPHPFQVKPDRYLVALRSQEVGRLLVGSPGWSSDDVWLIALSEWMDEQEALLLMEARGWLRTSLGMYTLAPLAQQASRARLELQVAQWV